MFSAFAYKGDSLRSSFDGLGEVVETSHGKKMGSQKDMEKFVPLEKSLQYPYSCVMFEIY